MDRWNPASDMERALGEAFVAGDAGVCQAILRSTPLVLPISEEAADGNEPAQWATVELPSGTHLVAFTSIEQMQEISGGAVRHGRVSSLVEMAAGWPDPSWSLFVNPGLDVQFLFTAATVARLAAPTIEQRLAANPGVVGVAVQKVLDLTMLDQLLTRQSGRVSGYVSMVVDTAHVATPRVLLSTLGHDVGHYLGADESVHVLRWYAIGSDLYRVPFGGTDAASRDAVEGWVIEERPFNGMGFFPNVDAVVAQYKVDSVVLPYGAEVWQLLADGTERRRAYFDADRDRWLVVAKLADIEDLGYEIEWEDE